MAAMTYEEMEKALAEATLTSLASAPKSVTAPTTRDTLIKTLTTVTHVIDKLEQQISELQGRIATLESRAEARYLGIWKSETEYTVGSLVTDHGAIWHCGKRTRDRPGSSADWQLAQKTSSRTESAPARDRNGSAGPPAQPRP
jgi:hypothetical protein